MCPFVRPATGSIGCVPWVRRSAGDEVAVARDSYPANRAANL